MFMFSSGSVASSCYASGTVDFNDVIILPHRMVMKIKRDHVHKLLSKWLAQGQCSIAENGDRYNYESGEKVELG